MKKNLVVLLIIVLLGSIVGCQKDKKNDVPNDPTIEITQNTEISEATVGIETQSNDNAGGDDLKADYEQLKENGLNASIISKFLEDNQFKLNSIIGTEVISDYIYYQREALGVQNEIFYSEAYLGMHQVISNAINAHINEFENNSLIGEQKYKILDYIKEEDYVQVLRQCFDEGLGLMSAEGSYYPVVDYYLLNSQYGGLVSDELKALFEITALEVKEPLTREEYLAVSAQELGRRAVIYETYLKTYPNGLYRDEVRNNLMVAIWKLVNPNPFDGMLEDDFTVGSDLEMVYQELLQSNDTPVVQTSVRGFLEFAASMNGILGSLDDMDALMEKSYALHEAASDQIFTLYNIEGFQ